jgi:hypothetical protein
VDSNIYTLQDFTAKVADYIDHEYGESNDLVNESLNDAEKMTIKHLLHAHYTSGDSINNSANHIIKYVRDSKQWMKENINE